MVTDSRYNEVIALQAVNLQFFFKDDIEFSSKNSRSTNLARVLLLVEVRL